MRIKLTSNNLGFSLVAAIVTLAAVTGTTAYLMTMSKNANVTSATSKATTFIEAERSRIATALADNNTCMRVENFGGQAPIRASINRLLSASGSAPGATLIEKNGKYFDNTLMIDNIQLRAVNATGSDPNFADAGNDKGYVLQIDYGDLSPDDRLAYTGKKRSMILIPMYLKVVGGVVAECYSLAQNSNINLAIRASCSPSSINTKKSSVLNLSGSVESDCQHSIMFATPNPNGDFTACSSSPPNTSPSTTTALSGWDLISSTISVPVSKCSGIATNCAVSEQSAFAISNSTASCSYAGGVRDGACGAGQILYHTSGTSMTCTSVSCPALHSFISAVSPTGASCYTAPATNCGPNEYVKVFNQNGADTCGILPSMSGNCGVNSFGKSITRQIATANGTLNCSPYSKVKSCPTPSLTTFAVALGATGSASCTKF